MSSVLGLLCSSWEKQKTLTSHSIKVEMLTRIILCNYNCIINITSLEIIITDIFTTQNWQLLIIVNSSWQKYLLVILFFFLFCFQKYLQKIFLKNSYLPTYLTIDLTFTSIVSLSKCFTLSELFPHPQSEVHNNTKLFMRIRGDVYKEVMVDSRHPQNGDYSYSESPH